MNELQTVEFELLKTFVDICNKLNLKYYLVCGSALGAVKYGGFIPWDDDIDVGLPREDYEVFCEKASSMLPKYLFLQNYRTDMNFPHVFSKLRDSRTTYIERNVAHLSMHHGVYIDIFPLDGYPRGNKEQKRLERKKAEYVRKLSCSFQMRRGLKAFVGYRLRCMLGYHKRTQVILDSYTKMISRTPTFVADIWCNHGNWQGKLEYASRKQYGDGTIMTFEGLEVRIPEKYDEYLTQKYGDWRADLPEDKKVGHHYYTVCDLDIPYTEYMKVKR